MTNEELEALIKETSEQIDQLPDDPEKPPSKQEKNRKVWLQLKMQALKKIQTTKEKGNLLQETRACMDYALLMQYGQKHPFLMHFLKSQMGWWGW
jgi:hypothetical protein